MAPEAPRRPLPLGSRAAVALALAIAALWGAHTLDLDANDLVPHEGGWTIAREFFAAALSPALRSEADFVPPGTPPLAILALTSAGKTIVLAAAALGLAIVLGTILGLGASTAWWADDPIGGEGPLVRTARRVLRPSIAVASRTLIAGLRSIHEILWAILFLTAIGLSEFAAVLAIALPTAGILAKVYAELVDEAPRSAALALRAAGAGGAQVYLFGLIVRSLPQMSAYTFYRFECALRSSAVLGFFGFSTIGLHIRRSFASGHHREVWTYLFVLIALVIVFDAWSNAFRKRIR